MILYQVHMGAIKVISVVRETASGWREHNNGFINRRRLSLHYPQLSQYYYTTDISEAKEWSKLLLTKIAERLQIAKASVDDVNFWLDNGGLETELPKSRFYNDTH